jgi:7-cyano-7-deazaguanine reductase
VKPSVALVALVACGQTYQAPYTVGGQTYVVEREVPSFTEGISNAAINDCQGGVHDEDRALRLVPSKTGCARDTFVIDYVPARWLVESKSLKLYLASFRNHGAFHEDCTLAIAGRLVEFLLPRWLRIGGYWYPRGGMPIDVFWQTGRPPAGLWIPEQGVAPYRGRG